MKFEISSGADIKCVGCGGTTRVAPNKVYNTFDLTCNCPKEKGLTIEVKKSKFKFFSWFGGSK